MTDEASRARQVFFLTLLATLVLRTLLAVRLPITGDEAYFYFWGRYPAWGFYDHPPMVGWWLAALRAVSDAPAVLRLPALLAPVFIALLGARVMRPLGEVRAWQAATLLLLLPLNAWNVAITTDVPLLVFGFATVVVYLRAVRTGRPVDYLACGLLLGGALLSKYFAGMLALALAGHALSQRRGSGLALLVAGSLPAALLQVAWNAGECWPNVMFNLVNRHDNAGWSWSTPPLYAVSLVYVLTPLVAWGVLRRPREPAGDAVEAAVRSALRWLVALPFGLFAVMSLVKRIGLHWLAVFTAPAVLLFARITDAAGLRRAMRFAMGFAALHYVLIAGVALLPLETFSRFAGYPGLVMTLSPDSLTQALAPWRGRFALASDGYSAASTMGFNLNEYVFVFGLGSSHARHDDILTDLRKLDGRDVLIIRRGADRGADDGRYFERVERRTIEVRGARFYLTEGYGFRYPAYRDAVLEVIRQRWYQVPKWLPAGPCYFCDRYFPDRACHR